MAKTKKNNVEAKSTGAKETKANKKEKGSKKKIEKRNIKKEMWFTLTEKETNVLGRGIGRLYTEKSKKENELKDITKRFRQEIGEFESDIAEKVNVINAGKEFRDVDCEEILDFGKEEVRYMFNKKVHISRPMTDKEKQMSLSIKLNPITNIANNKKLSIVTEADKKKSADIKEVIKEETKKSTKTSPIDNVSKAHNKSAAYSDLMGSGE